MSTLVYDILNKQSLNKKKNSYVLTERIGLLLGRTGIILVLLSCAFIPRGKHDSGTEGAVKDRI